MAATFSSQTVRRFQITLCPLAGAVFSWWSREFNSTVTSHANYQLVLLPASSTFESRFVDLKCFFERINWENSPYNRPFQLVHFVFPFQTTRCPHGNFPFVFFISYAYICTCIRRHLKETIPSSSITWSEMGKRKAS